MRDGAWGFKFKARNPVENASNKDGQLTAQSIDWVEGLLGTKVLVTARSGKSWTSKVQAFEHLNWSSNKRDVTIVATKNTIKDGI